MTGPAPNSNSNNSIIWPELWSAFASHRDKILGLLQPLSSSADSRLAVWGAGRTTDLDLIALSGHYGRIDLFDLDPKVTSEALVQRGFDTSSGVTAYGGVDLTGAVEYWNQFNQSPTEETLKELIDFSYQHEIDIGEYDVVISTCLLSQIMRFAVESIQSSSLPESVQRRYLTVVLRALREKHLERLLTHTRRGGHAVLVTDITSSDALPEINDPNANLVELLSTKVGQGNHFYGVSPAMIAKSIRRPAIAKQIAQVKVGAPWIWDSIESRYLCLSLQFRKIS